MTKLFSVDSHVRRDLFKIDDVPAEHLWEPPAHHENEQVMPPPRPPQDSSVIIIIIIIIITHQINNRNAFHFRDSHSSLLFLPLLHFPK